MRPLTVAGLIEFLQTQPQNLPVAFQQYSEYALLQTEQISVEQLLPNRVDGYVGRARPDKPKRPYLVFPGN